MEKEIKKPISLKLIYFEGDKWNRRMSGEWVNISKVAKSKSDQDLYVKGMINEYLQDKRKYNLSLGVYSKDDEVTSTKINGYFNKLMIDTVYNKNISLHDIDRDKIELLDCVVDIKLGTTTYRKNRDTIFTPYQIRREIYNTYNTFVNDPTKMSEEQKTKKKLVDDFFKEVSGYDKVMETSLLEVIGSTMAPVNDSIFPIFYSPHRSSGKGTIIEIISNINNATREIKGDKWWGVNQSNFALSNIRNKLAAYIDEVPVRLPQASTETIKRYADSKEYLEIERKTIDQEQTLNTLTFLATTNKRTQFYSIDDSLKGRVIWYEFKMNRNKSKDNVFSKEQIKTITKDRECLEYIIIKSINAYAEVSKRKGDRNQSFTRPKSNEEFWKNAEEDNIALEIIRGDKTLSELWDAKDIFIASKDIKKAVENYKSENKDEIPKSYNSVTFKNEMIDYIHSKNLGNALVKAYKNVKGVRITWFDKGDK